VVLFGVPGAFTGVCSQAHVPGFASSADAFKALGVDTIACVSVNDAYTMNTWAQKMGITKEQVCRSSSIPPEGVSKVTSKCLNATSELRRCL
jgi:peroxiredoxin